MFNFGSGRPFVLVAGQLALSALITLPGWAQSLDVKHPAPLKAGVNRATIDSFGGEQFWTFTAQPGHFQLTFVRSGPQEGFSVGPKAGVGAVFAPKTPGAELTSKDSPSGTVFEGRVTQPTRVVILIEPAKSPLVRQTNDYTLEATGAVASGDGGGAGAQTGAAGGGGQPSQPGPSGAGPSVVGVYNVGLNDWGAAKFAADGTIVTASGAKGTWEVFDADTRTYVVTVGGTRFTLTFQPGRGFVDNNSNLVFQSKIAH